MIKYLSDEKHNIDAFHFYTVTQFFSTLGDVMRAFAL